MLSALLKRVKSFERELEKQGNYIEDLKSKIDGPVFTDLSSRDAKDILFRYQAKLKELGFEINHIKSKMSTQEDSVQKIKQDLIKMGSDKRKEQQNTTPPVQTRTQSIYNPIVEFPGHPSGSCLGSVFCGSTATTSFPTNASWQFQGNEHGMAELNKTSEVIIAERCVQETQASKAVWNGFEKVDQKLPHSPFEGEFNSFIPHPETLRAERIAFQTRIAELEADCKLKDRLLQELGKKEQRTKQQEDLASKLDWCEHKMRLLKQDKRRRGETIGKLLRSIDEMKDAGKLDMSRAQEGRGILTTALSTRGQSPEQRIHAAISVTNSERSFGRRDMNGHPRLSESSNHSGSDDTESESYTPRTANTQAF